MNLSKTLFSEKNLPALIILIPMVIIVFFASMMIFFVIQTQYSNFEDEVVRLESEYLQRQKNLLKDENEKIHAYLQFQRELNDRLEMDKKSSDEELQRRAAKWIEKVRYGTNGYVWIHDTNYHLVAHPFRQESIGSNDKNGTDSNGDLIFQKFIDTAKSNDNGGFVEYYWARPDFGAPAKKIGFLKLDKEWGWVIGTGLYVDDITSFVAQKKQDLEAKIDSYVFAILTIAFVLTVMFGVLSFLLSKSAVGVLQSYRHNVAKKEHSLKELNASLSTKITAALEEAKQKDQAMLHQSRLAQMGEMLSMIAHQWRQPLMEISAIFMELQSAAKFQKADKNYIDSQSKEADTLIRYMSQTIDDFRDFFKPEGDKEDFSVTAACKEALSLSEAALKSKNIALKFTVHQDAKVHGFSSQFAQVILNLILNAKDALIDRQISKPKIYISVDLKKESVHVSITDNAGGIDENIMSTVFEPYVTTKQGTGTGLGLYMAKVIIENNMHGSLHVSNDDQGALFQIELPKI